MWRTQPLSPTIRTVSYTTEPIVRLTADALAETQVSYQHFLDQLKPHRVQFAKWALADSSLSSDAFAWPQPTPADVINAHRSTGGRIRVWGSPTNDQLESAVATALLRLNRAEEMARRVGRQAKAAQAPGTPTANPSTKVRLEAAAYQARLRLAEYRLALAIEDAYATPSPRRLKDFEEQAVALFRLHTNNSPLTTLAAIRVETLTQETNRRQAAHQSGTGAWKAWTDSRVQLGRAEVLLESLVRQQSLASRQVQLLAQLLPNEG